MAAIDDSLIRSVDEDKFMIMAFCDTDDEKRYRKAYLLFCLEVCSGFKTIFGELFPDETIPELTENELKKRTNYVMEKITQIKIDKLKQIPRKSGSVNSVMIKIRDLLGDKNDEKNKLKNEIESWKKDHATIKAELDTLKNTHILVEGMKEQMERSMAQTSKIVAEMKKIEEDTLEVITNIDISAFDPDMQSYVRDTLERISNFSDLVVPIPQDLQDKSKHLDIITASISNIFEFIQAIPKGINQVDEYVNRQEYTLDFSDINRDVAQQIQSIYNIIFDYVFLGKVHDFLQKKTEIDTEMINKLNARRTKLKNDSSRTMLDGLIQGFTGFRETNNCIETLENLKLFGYKNEFYLFKVSDIQSNSLTLKILDTTTQQRTDGLPNTICERLLNFALHNLIKLFNYAYITNYCITDPQNNDSLQKVPNFPVLFLETLGTKCLNLDLLNLERQEFRTKELNRFLHFIKSYETIDKRDDCLELSSLCVMSSMLLPVNYSVKINHKQYTKFQIENIIKNMFRITTANDSGIVQSSDRHELLHLLGFPKLYLDQIK